jgi:hypothetical protein
MCCFGFCEKKKKKKAEKNQIKVKTRYSGSDIGFDG